MPSPASSVAGVSSATISPSMDDRHPVAELLSFVEIVGGEQDRHVMARAQASDHVQELVTNPRIEADGWLIQEQHLRLGHERARDLETAALATTEALNRPVDQLGDPERLDQLVDPGGGGRRRHAPELGVEIEVRPATETTVDDRLLEDDAADAASLPRLVHDVIAGQPRAPGRRQHRGGQHPDRRRLTGAVRTEKAEDLTGRDVEVDPLDRLNATAVDLAQRADLDGRPVEFGVLVHMPVACGAHFSIAELPELGVAGHIGRSSLVTPMTTPDRRV